MMSLLIGYLVVVTVIAMAAYAAGITGRTRVLYEDPDADASSRDRGRERKFAFANLAGAALHVAALLWLAIATRAGHELSSWPVLVGVAPLVIIGAVALQASTSMLRGGATAGGVG